MNEPLPQIPPLGGLCSYEEASRTSLSVEDCVEWLKRLHYVWKRLHQIFTSHITAEPIYELKTAFSLHAHLCAEHAQAIRTRVSEMREPPLGLEVFVGWDQLALERRPTTLDVIPGKWWACAQSGWSHPTARHCSPHSGVFQPGVGSVLPQSSSYSPSRAMRWNDDHSQSRTRDTKLCLRGFQ